MVTMRRSGSALILLALCMVVAVPSMAAAKMGYFDFQVVLDKSKVGQTAQDEYKRETEKYRSEIEDKARQFKALKDDADKKKGALDDATKKKMDGLKVDVEKLSMEAQGKTSKLNNDLMKPLIDRVMDLVKKIGRDDKYDCIIEVNKGGVVYFNEKDDLTNRLVQELDKSGPAKK
jgi:outer membrane protein